MSVKPYSTEIGDRDKRLIDLINKEDALQKELRELTRQQVKHHSMMSTPEQVRFLAFLIRLQQAQRVIEVGVFTGYATLSMAQALPESGYLLACDKNSEWPTIGIPYWQRAGMRAKIDLKIAPALETLQAAIDEGQEATFDLIYIDADKIRYPNYAEMGYLLLRPGGILIFDNVVRVGPERVVDQRVPATRAIAALLETMSQESRYDLSLLPIAEGMLLARKRAYIAG